MTKCVVVNEILPDKDAQEQLVVDAKKIAMKKLNALGLNTTDLQALGL